MKKAFVAISPTVTSLDIFQRDSGIQSRRAAREIAEFYAASGIGTVAGSRISYSAADKIRAAMLCIKNGCGISEISTLLSWKDFEQLASTILTSCGYRTRTNVRFVKPRMEIDVVGTRFSLALIIDCKHWKHGNLSSISTYSRKQEARTVRFVKENHVKQAVPLILTLHAESVKFVGGIPIVPITQFGSFITDMEAYLPEILVIGQV